MIGRMAALALLTLGLVACASRDDRIFPAGSSFDGRGDLQLTTDWWQWALSADQAHSPLSDVIGSRCGVGQSGPVWFLAGGEGGRTTRTCKVPAGKALFFPVMTMVYYPAPDGSPYTCDDAKYEASINNDSAQELFAELDGVEIPAVEDHRIATEDCFDAFSRSPDHGGGQRGSPAATDGYWLFIKPLSPGTHTLKFGGRYDDDSNDYGHMVQDVEYELQVQ